MCYGVDLLYFFWQFEPLFALGRNDIHLFVPVNKSLQ